MALTDTAVVSLLCAPPLGWFEHRAPSVPDTLAQTEMIYFEFLEHVITFRSFHCY